MQIQGMVPEQKGMYMIYTMPMLDEENNSL